VRHPILCREWKAQSGAVLGFPTGAQNRAEYEQPFRCRLYWLALSHLVARMAEEISVFNGHLRGSAASKMRAITAALRMQHLAVWLAG